MSGPNLAQIVFNGTKEAIVITDRDNRIVSVNAGFTNITGYTLEEVRGRDPKLLSSGFHDREFYAGMWNVLKDSGHWTGEIHNRRKNGETYIQWLSVTVAKNNDNCVANYVAIFSDITQSRKDQEALHRLAHYDTLTGLPNRLLFEDRLQQAILRATRHGTQVVVMMLDVDRCKIVNDTLGHSAGDSLLRGIAQRVQECLRESDTLCRFTGDQFTAILPDLDDADVAVGAARRILSALQAPFDLAGQEVFTSASIGLSVFPDCGNAIEDLLKAADLAMYHSKEQGGGRYTLCNRERCFLSACRPDGTNPLALESGLRQALEKKEFILQYQPKVDVETGTAVGAEALMRWRRSDGSLVPPAEFIPLAEETGLIVPIGEWVVDMVCRQLKAWKDEGLPEIAVGINVSARQFREANLVETIKQAMDRHGVEPRQIVVELTESILVENPDGAARTLKELKKVGVALSLDDFGTGYSSLSYLTRFPLDELKIDRSFVTELVSSPRDALVARAIVSLGHTLGLSIVAEGVETEAQATILARYGCDLLQGYHFSMPIHPEQFAEGLRLGTHWEVRHGRAPETPRTLLLLDDEQAITSALKRMLRTDGYRILTAHNAREAYDLLALNPVQVVIADQRMPEISGTEFLGRIKDLYPDTVRMVLSGYTEISAITRAINEGAIYKFLTKPWEDDELRREIGNAFAYHDRQTERASRRAARECLDEQRQYVRFPARWPVNIHCVCGKDGQPKCWEALTRNVSLGGFCLGIKHNLCWDKEFSIHLTVPPSGADDLPNTIELKGRLIHTAWSNADNAFHAGIETTWMNEGDRACLERHLEASFGRSCYSREEHRPIALAAPSLPAVER